MLLLIVIFALFIRIDGATCVNPLKEAWTPPGFCATVWAESLGTPRGLLVASNNDILVVDQRSSNIYVLFDTNNNGISDPDERATLASAPGLNHGIAIFGNYLYASSSQIVYRWKYFPGNRTNLGNYEVVITGIPCCHHTTRTLVFDKFGALYVTCGSGSNVDPDSTHSRIKRFAINTLPITWASGVLFADGLRNEVGIRFDSANRLWGVENGCDDLNRRDLGGDIHNDNPSEKLNLFPAIGKFYGYPYCFTEYKIPAPYGKGVNTQWAHPDFLTKGYTDAWCQNTSNVIPPKYSLPAHTAPMDIIFYETGSFPKNYSKNAFVSMHGSWNRQPAVGYKIVHVLFDNTGMPYRDEDFLKHTGSSATWPNKIRPVGLGIGKCPTGDCLYTSSDASGQIIRISYSNTN